MARKAKMIGEADTQPETAVEERATLLLQTREQQVRIRAYEIHLGRGEQPGFELEDWLQAERELTSKEEGSAHESELSQFPRGESIPMGLMGTHRELTGGQGRELRPVSAGWNADIPSCRARVDASFTPA